MSNATPLTPRATAPFRFAWPTRGTAALALVALVAGGCAHRSPQAPTVGPGPPGLSGRLGLVGGQKTGLQRLL
ncbi:MAG: hypothetical protein ACKOGB_00450, partial [Betaproteobacteria bacterium]